MITLIGTTPDYQIVAVFKFLKVDLSIQRMSGLEAKSVWLRNSFFANCSSTFL
jgi:hypothetical protein